MRYNKAYRLKLVEVIFLLLVLVGLSQYSDIVADLQTQVLTNAGLLWIAVGVLLGLSIILSIVWQLFDKKLNLHEWFQTIIVYYIAHQIANFGVSKILQIQFQLPNQILERPVGELNGYWMTWTYFGFSPTFTIILGSLQILGSILLLFKKTRLLGAVVLLPIMINVCFIEHFYQISPLAYFNSLHYTGVLLFVLLQYFDDIIHLLFSYKEYFYFDKKTILLNLARIIVIGGAFFHIYWLKSHTSSQTSINGVWRVDEITAHNKTIIPATAPAEAGWTKIYFEQNSSCLFKYNADRFNDKKDWQGQFEVDQSRKQTNIVFRRGNKVEYLKLAYEVEGSSMTLMGIYQNAPLIMKLTRLK